MEKTLLKTEQRQTRDEVATYLESITEKLRSGEDITLKGGGESVTLDVPNQVTFEVKVEEENGTELSMEFELEWDTTQDEADEELQIS